jgi:hypothetical protein
MSYDDEGSATSCSMDFCDIEVPTKFQVPCQTVHFQMENLNIPKRNDGDHCVPLEKVGKNYRSLRRRGAAVHSQLLKNAFEASMSSYEDEDEDGDDYSMYASNSTLASRDGIEEMVTAPRKRIRNDDKEIPCVLGNLFGHMVLKNNTIPPSSSQHQQHRASFTSVSTKGNLQISKLGISPHEQDHQSL